MRSTTKLKSLVAERQALTVPGAANALFARVVEEVGFPVVYATGAGIAGCSPDSSRCSAAAGSLARPGRCG